MGPRPQPGHGHPDGAVPAFAKLAPFSDEEMANANRLGDTMEMKDGWGAQGGVSSTEALSNSNVSDELMAGVVPGSSSPAWAPQGYASDLLSLSHTTDASMGLPAPTKTPAPTPQAKPGSAAVGGGAKGTAK